MVEEVLPVEINADPERWFEALIRYGLYLAALFQLVCICALFFIDEHRSHAAEPSAAPPATSSKQKRHREKKRR